MASSLVTAAWRYLMATPVPAALISSGLLGSDPTGGPYARGWVFSGFLGGDPYRAVEGSGKCAVVLYQYDTWAPATQMHTLRYPRLLLAIYADDTRDTLGNPVTHDAEARVESIYAAVNPLFHDPGNRVRFFDRLRVISTIQGQGLSVMEIPNGDGAVRGTVAYDLTLD